MVAACRYSITREIRHIIRAHLDGELQDTVTFKKFLQNLHDLAAQVDVTVEKLLHSAQQYDEHHSEVQPQTESSTRGTVTPDTYLEPWVLYPLAPSTKACHTVATFETWAAMLLHLMMHRSFCILYQPFFRSAITTQNHAIREGTLHHAQAYVALFLRLCEHPNSGHYHWTYPRIYQPLQALSLLLADLLSSPNSTSQDREISSISRGLIDSVFELYEAGEGFVNEPKARRRQLSAEGNLAWTMLLQARRAALERMNQDSHILIPSSTLSTGESCICGKRIAVELRSLYIPRSTSGLLERDGNGATARGAPSLQDFSSSAWSSSNDEERILGVEDDLNTAVDWDLWDAVFGHVPSSLS
jgi:hypothetical protein